MNTTTTQSLPVGKRWIHTGFALGITTLCLLPQPAQAQYWNRPYAWGSTTDQQLRFNNGAAGTVTAPSPALTLVIGTNNTPANGTGGGWSTRAQGSTSVGVGVPPFTVLLAASNAQTRVNDSKMTFAFVNQGLLANLIGVSLTMQWQANSIITASNTWVQYTDLYYYEFDVNISSSLLTGNVGVFDSITLTINAGTTQLYSQTGLASILGILNLTETTYLNQKAHFSYDQSLGPLEIIWSATTPISTNLLNALLDNGTDNMFTVSNGMMYNFNTIPEPGTWALLIGGAGTLLLLKRRRLLS